MAPSDLPAIDWLRAKGQSDGANQWQADPRLLFRSALARSAGDEYSDLLPSASAPATTAGVKRPLRRSSQPGSVGKSTAQSCGADFGCERFLRRRSARTVPEVEGCFS